MADTQQHRIEFVALSELIRHPRNPKGHDIERLEESIDRFGFVQPLMIDERTQHLVAGHGRLDTLAQKKAAGEEPPERIVVRHGEWLVPVIRGVAFESDADAEAYLIADNRLVELGGWEDEALATMLVELREADSLTGTGYDAGEVEELLGRLADNGDGGGHTDPDDVPEVPTDPVAQVGDLWRLGPHSVVCGDALVLEDWDRACGGRRPDMVFTDPPYNVNYGTIKHRKFRQRQVTNDAQSPEDWARFCSELVDRLAARVEGCIYVCHAPGPDGIVLLTGLNERLHWSATIVWVKDVFTLGRGKYQRRYEPVWFGWANDGKRFTADRSLDDVWEIPRPKKSEEHPTMKPVALVERALEHATQKGELVFDPFLGSGTTLIAAQQTGRVCAGLEIEPRYVDVTVKRWEEFTGEKAEVIRG